MPKITLFGGDQPVVPADEGETPNHGDDAK
jgi:hypothetical protein